MPGELITEEQPRIKFRVQREAEPLVLPGDCTAVLSDLAALMAELEGAGAIPILNDGLAAGNCAVAASLLRVDGDGLAAAAPTCSTSSNSDATGTAAAARPAAVLVSRSGKRPGAVMGADDWVLLTAFDPGSWSALYRSASEAARPTSDAPLHVAALADWRQHGWQEAPLVAVHGHALAEGPGLDAAARLCLPISHEATLFSTPEDRQQLCELFAAFPYPQHTCYIRRGHGFFILGPTVECCRRSFREQVLPTLAACSGGGDGMQ